MTVLLAWYVRDWDRAVLKAAGRFRAKDSDLADYATCAGLTCEAQ